MKKRLSLIRDKFADRVSYAVNWPLRRLAAFFPAHDSSGTTVEFRIWPQPRERVALFCLARAILQFGRHKIRTYGS